jgi:CHAT domain-containing protein
MDALAALQSTLHAVSGTPEETPIAAACHLELGRALHRLSRLDDAVTHYRNAIALFEETIGTERERALCLRLLAHVLGDQRQYDEAFRCQERALSLLETLPIADADRAACYTCRGILLSRMERLEEAVHELERAVALYETSSGPELDQAQSLLAMGACLMKLDRSTEALPWMERALHLLQGIDFTEYHRALCHQNLAVSLRDLGRYEQAIDSLVSTIEALGRMPGCDRHIAFAHDQIGTSLTRLGRPADGARKHVEAMGRYEQIAGAPWDQALCRRRLAQDLIALGRAEEAIPHLLHALTLFEPIAGTARQRAACLQTHGQALVELGCIDEALARYDEAMALLEAGEAPYLDRAVGHRLAAEALLRSGRSREAASRFEQALALYKPEENRKELWEAHYGLGQAREASGDAAGALSAYLTASEYLEDLRRDIKARANMLSFFEEKAVVYPRLIALLLSDTLPDPFAAAPRLAAWGMSVAEVTLRFSEASKSRALIDLMQERDLSAAADPEWDREEKLLSDAISNTYVELQALAREAEAQRPLRERIQALELDRDLVEMRRKRLGVGADRGRRAQRGPVAPGEAWSGERVTAPTLAEIQALLAPGEALLEYAKLEAGPAQPSPALALWIVTAGGLRMFHVPLPAGGTEADLPALVRRLRLRPSELGLEERVRLFRAPMERKLQTRGILSVREHQRVGRLLADAVLPPEAREHLAAAGVRRLAIVPDGVLHHVPFAALILREDPDPSLPPRYEACRYLIQRFTITTLPSANALAEIRASAAERSALRALRADHRQSLVAFADPVFTPADPRWAAIPTGPSKEESPHAGGYLATYYAQDGLDDQRLPATADEALAVAALFPEYEVHSEPALTPRPPLPMLGEGEPSDPSPAGTPLPALGEGQGVRADPSEGVRTPQSQVYLGVAASKERLRSLPLSHYRYLLLATHAQVDAQNPWLSCVRLTPTVEENGFLQAHEVFRLILDAEVVTLSACQSGLGRLARGEGMIGFVTAFFMAGTRSLVTTLWKVADEPTSRLVQSFHRYLREGDREPVEALRQTQLEMIAGGGLSAHPYFWGLAFMGDWGVPGAAASKNTPPAASRS